MPRSLANSLYERLLRSFPADRAYTKADWEGDAMPKPVRHFLIQLLQHHSNREARRLRRARTEWVDYDHPEMEQAVRTFFAAVESHTQVPRNQWDETLHRTAHHITAHLVRPVPVLTDFVFGDQTEPLRVRQVLWRMRFFGPYAYLRDAIQAFTKKRTIDALKPDQFERVLKRVDQRITADFDADRWLHLLEALFNVARCANGRKEIETRLLRSFFTEKEALPIVQRLTTHEQKGHDVVGPKELHRLIEEAQNAPLSSAEPSAAAPSAPASSPPESLDPAEPPEPPSSPEFPSDPQAPPSPEDDIWGVAGSARPANSESDASATTEENPNGETPLWKQFQQGRTGGSADDGASQTSNSQKPLWAQFRRDRSASASDPAPPSPKPKEEAPPSSNETPSVSLNAQTDLSTLEHEVLGTSNPPHRAVYIRQLFGGDESAYRHVLERLRSTESWGEASQIIAGEVFRTHKVNIYSDAAVHFTNAIESRFRS